MQKNTELKDTIVCYVRDHPGLNRTQIATGLQKNGVLLSVTHLRNTCSEMSNRGELSQVLTTTGEKIIFLPSTQGLPQPAAAKP